MCSSLQAASEHERPVLKKTLSRRLLTISPPDTSNYHPDLAQNNKLQQQSADRVVFVAPNCEKKKWDYSIMCVNIEDIKSLVARFSSKWCVHDGA